MRCRLLTHPVALFLLSAVSAMAGDTEDALERAKRANVAKDYVASITIYERLAQEGRPEGMMYLGLMYAAGAGVERNPVHACDLYQQAAEKGLALAQHLLGDCFFSGNGRLQDYVQSKAWYEKAMQAGNPKAHCALGNQYMRGLGVPRDLEHGMALCRKAADLGDADAQADLASAYLAQTSPQAHKQAFDLLTKAVAQGHARAAINLGNMYWNGDGVEKDRAAAAQLFLRAWQGRRPEAAFLLGKYYFIQAVDLERRQVRQALGLQALYWLSVANKIDPTPENRVEAGELAQNLKDVEPSLTAALNEWLKTNRGPPPLPQ